MSEYVDQRLGDLRLLLTTRPPRRERFRVFREAEVAAATYHADLWIIGSSHVLSFRAGDLACGEILTCRDEGARRDDIGDLEEARDLSRVRLERSIGDSISYEIDVETTRYDADGLRTEQGRLVADADPDCLVHMFPRGDPTQVAPMTLLRVQKADDHILSLTTAHSYPQDLAMVLTRTTIRLT